MDSEWFEMILHGFVYSFVFGLLVFFISFFGSLGYRAGDGFIKHFFSEKPAAIDEHF